MQMSCENTLPNSNNRLTAVITVVFGLIFLGLAVVGHLNSRPGGWPAYSLVVDELQLDLSQPQEYRGQLLWETFANSPQESQFRTVKQANWYERSRDYQNRLVDLARDKHLEFEALQKALRDFLATEGSSKAEIPVAAYQAKRGDEKVWIILAKWEIVGFGDTMGHIKIGAYSVTSGELVDYVTCD